jgi:hypothetical protein
MSIRVDMVPVIDYEEIECEFEKSIQEFEFYHCAEDSDGYFWVNTDEDAIADLEDEKENEIRCADKYNYTVSKEYLERIDNDIRLIKLMQEMGLNDGVLIYVWN